MDKVTIDKTSLSGQDLLEMAPAGWRTSFAWFKVIAIAFFLPLTALFLYGPLSVLVYPYAYTMRKWNRAANYGRDTIIPIEILLALVFIPVSGLVATFGSGLSFYLLTTEIHRTAMHQRTIPFGWQVLGFTILLVIVMVGGGLWLLLGYRSGQVVLPYEPDVDPEKAIAYIRKQRTLAVPCFLPGRAICAAQWADETPLADSQSGPRITIRQAWRRLVAKDNHQSPDRKHLTVVLLLVVAWVAGIFAWETLNGRLSWRFLLVIMYAALSFAAFCLTAVAGLILRYYVQLRYRRRLAVLHQRLDEAPHGPTISAEPWTQELFDQLERLQVKVADMHEALNALTVCPKFRWPFFHERFARRLPDVGHQHPGTSLLRRSGL